jgi:hypothetical protein
MQLREIQQPEPDGVRSPEIDHDGAAAFVRPVRDYFRISFTVGVFVLLTFIAHKGWSDLDESWDSLAYHMPFAALRAGVISQQQYHLSKWIGGIYAGLPVLPDYLQGGLWRLTSRAQAANLVGLFALILVAAFFRLRHKIPFAYIVAGFLAVPVILIQTTSTDVDLFTNSFATILLFSIFIAWIDPEQFTTADTLVAVCCVTVVINSKSQFVVIGTWALLLLGIVVYANRHRLVLVRQQMSGPTWKRYLFIIVVLLAVGLAYVIPIRNLVRFHNPIYPVALRIGPIQMQGQFDSHGLGGEPIYLAHSPQWDRFVRSVVEYDAFDGRNPLWTNSQGDVKLDSRALRMGGTFSAWTLFNVFFFVILQRKVKHRYGWKPSVFIALLIVSAAFMPASQEIRYYMYWLMCLIALNLFLIEHGLNGPERDVLRMVAVAAISSSLIFVLCSNGLRYVRANGHSPQVLVTGANIAKQLEDMHLQDGEAVCLEGKMPRAFLYSPNFNAGVAAKLHYRIREGWMPQDEAEDCAGSRIVP